MEQINLILKKYIFYLYYNRYIVLILISFVSFGTIFLNIIGFGDFLNLSVFQLLFQILCLISTGFIVIFLPFYPLFFIIFRKKGFNRLEKVSLTSIANLTFYILTAYFANILGIAITGFFFFILILITYTIQITYIILIERRRNSYVFFKLIKISNHSKESYSTRSLVNYAKRIFPLNGILVSIFLILLAILHGVRFSYFYGTDAMYHVFVSKLITELNYLPVDQYFGAVGLHLFAGLIHFFTGIDHLLIAKFFSFYTFFVSAGIIYIILCRIFKNRNLAILGVFLLELTSLGFSNMMYQFWPTSLASIQSLFIFFLLYNRLENFLAVKAPSKKDLISNLIFTYIFIVLIFVSALFTHSIIAMVYFGSFLFIFLIYFVRSYKRGIDFILLGFCLILFIILLETTHISAHWPSFNLLSLPWYFLAGAGIIGVLIILKLRRGIDFEPDKFKSTILGQKHSYYKKIEDKYIFPLFYSFVFLFVILFIVLNLNLFYVNFSKILILIETFTMILFGIWGIYIFQKKPRGKILWLWLIGIGIIYIAALVLDVFVYTFTLSGRILLMISPVFIFGFVSYVYKLLTLNSIKKIKIFILSVVVLTFFTQFTDQLLDIDDIEYSLHRREVYSIQYYVNYTSDVNHIICEFGIPYVVFYYGYPYAENNKSIDVRDIFDYTMEPKGFFKPSDHFYANGTNKLQQLKQELNTDIYLLLDDNYLAFTGFDVYERLTEAEMASYYYMDYLNKIASCKSENGIIFPYYWVI